LLAGYECIDLLLAASIAIHKFCNAGNLHYSVLYFYYRSTTAANCASYTRVPSYETMKQRAYCTDGSRLSRVTCLCQTTAEKAWCFIWFITDEKMLLWTSGESAERPSVRRSITLYHQVL